MSSPLQYSTSVEDNEDALSVGTTPPVDAGAPAYVMPSGHPRFGFMSAPVVTTTPPPFPAGALRRSQSFASTRGLRTSPMSPPRSTIRVHCGVWTARAVLDSVATGPPCLVRWLEGHEVTSARAGASNSVLPQRFVRLQCSHGFWRCCTLRAVALRPPPELRFHVHGPGWRARVHCWYVLVECLCIPSPLRLRAACTRPRMCFVLLCRLLTVCVALQCSRSCTPRALWR